MLNTLERLVRKMKATAIYLALGAGCHALFLGMTFQVGNLWSWFWLLAWPAGLSVAVFLFCLFFGVVLVVAVGTCCWVEDHIIASKRLRARRVNL